MAEDPVLSGAAMVRAAGFELSIPSAVVLVFDESLVPRSRRRDGVGKRHPFRRVAVLDRGVSVVCAAGPGSPSAAVAVEFLAAFGVDTVVAVGTAGDLHGSLPTAMHSVVEAVSDEGTSGHYRADLPADRAFSDAVGRPATGDEATPAPSSAALSADRALGGALIAAAARPAITTLTTDVPFRHTPERLEQHRRVADVVEMECAAVFAVARAFNMRAGALVVVSDGFEGGEWRMRDGAEVDRALTEAVATAAATIDSGSDWSSGDR